MSDNHRLRMPVRAPTLLGAVLLTTIICLSGARTTSAVAAPAACASSVSATTPAPPSTTSAGAGPCWTDVTPYPFGDAGGPVDPSSPRCRPNAASGDVIPCYLTVTSLAFRSWNRGLAATAATAGTANQFGVWLFNGTRWLPNLQFPGSSVCKGTTVLWAGKLDYWLVGGPTNWSSLCRFDSANFEWEPLAVPQATLDRVPQVPVRTDNAPKGTPTTGPTAGSITSGACFDYANCWFFGSYGSVLHWNGTTLADASPDPSLGWLGTAYTAAVARTDLGGSPFGLAVGATSSNSAIRASSAGTPLPAAPGGTPPPQLYGSAGAVFGPLPFAAPTASIPTDPERTDLVGVDFGTDRQGWVAGNPAGLIASAVGASGFTGAAAFLRPAPRPGPAPDSVTPAPLLTTTAAGAGSTCSGPPTDRFTYSASLSDPLDAFLWSSISLTPGTDDALAGGVVWPSASGAGADTDGAAEPVIVAASCDGTTTTTRFRTPDPRPPFNGATTAPLVPADRDGTISAIAANATNDAWAATTVGGFSVSAGGLDQQFDERPHLYRLTDGQAPAAPSGDDSEQRPLNLQLDPPPIARPTPPPPPAPPAAGPGAPKPTRDPPSAVFDVKSKLRGTTKLTLCLTFRLRRPTTLGAEALRDGRVVSSAPLHHFTGHRGQLVLAINAKAYPTQVRFVSDAPKVRLVDPGQRLSSSVKLRATATAIRGRRIVSVSFEYSASGRATWTTIDTATASPWTVVFSTTALAAGRYDLRTVATDSAHVSGVSPILARRAVARSPSSP